MEFLILNLLGDCSTTFVLAQSLGMLNLLAVYYILKKLKYSFMH